jgi:hypothetical protein
MDSNGHRIDPWVAAMVDVILAHAAVSPQSSGTRLVFDGD